MVYEFHVLSFSTYTPLVIDTNFASQDLPTNHTNIWDTKYTIYEYQ